MFGFARQSDVDRLSHEVAALRLMLQQFTADLDAALLKLSRPPAAAPTPPTEPPVSEPSPAKESSVGTTMDLPTAGDFVVDVVGESYRQGPLKALAGERRKHGEEVFFTAALVPDPGNAFDPHAIKIFIHGGAHVGYLSRETALEYRAVTETLISLNAAGLCRAKLIGGQTGKPSIGVVLDLAGPAEVLQAIAPAQAF